MNHHDTYLKWALIASVAVLFSSLGQRALWDPDEARYAEIAREIHVLHDWVTPHLNYLPYLEKPMLYMWLVAISFKIFGVTESSAHIVSLACALGGIYLVGLMAWRLWGLRAGLIASLSLVTTLEYFFLSCAVDINMPLTLFITSACVFFWLGHTEKKTTYFLLSWGSMALATLTKGPIGVILPLGAICMYILLTKQFTLIRESRPILGILVLLAVASPWFILVSMRNPDFFSFFFVNQNFERFVTSNEHNKPFYYFIFVILVGALPWTIVLVPAMKRIWQNRMQREVLYILVWFFLIFFFFMPSHSKLATYMLPCFPPLALLIGYICRDDPPDRGGLPLYAAGMLWMCLGIALIIFPTLVSLGVVNITSAGLAPLMRIGPISGTVIILGIIPGVWVGRKYDSALGIAILGTVLMFTVAASAPQWDSIRSTRSLVWDLPAAVRLFSYGSYYQSSSFYSRRQVGLVETMGELEFGIRHSQKRGIYLTLDELAELMNEDTDAYCLTSIQNIPTVREKIPHIAIRRQSGDVCLLNCPKP